ncbi:MAG: DUF4397 domain-containing protein [Flavobacteriales bacterium]|nr:DUF4397 domain-containing protein [Flavobacteriales bacterium]
MNRILLLASLFFGLTFFSACDPDPVDPEEQEAHVMYIHAAPNVPSLYIDNVEANHDVGPIGYGHHSGYTIAYLNNVNYVVKSPGLTPTVWATITSPPWEAGKYYTVVIYQDNSSATGISLHVIEDQLHTPADGKVGYRFLNFAHDAPVLDLVHASGTTWFENVPFYGDDAVASITGYQDYAPGSTILSLRENGTGTTLYQHWALNSTENRVFTVVASGYVGSSASNGIQIQFCENERD